MSPTKKRYTIQKGFKHIPTRRNSALSSRALSSVNLICIIKWKLAFAGVLQVTKRQYFEEWLQVVPREGYDKFQTVMKDEYFLDIWLPEKKFYLRKSQLQPWYFRFFCAASNCLKSLSPFSPLTSWNLSFSFLPTAASNHFWFYIQLLPIFLYPFLCPLLPDPSVLSYPNCCLVPLSFFSPTAAWSLCPFLPQLLLDPFVLSYLNCSHCPLLFHLLSNDHVLIPTASYSSCPHLSRLLPNPLFSYIPTAA